jgi:hypothetical protein
MDESKNVDPSMAADGVSRRDALKKGAIAGGALLWVPPAVQAIGMTRAGAQTPSPPGGCTSGGANDLQLDLTGLVTASVGPFRFVPGMPGCITNVVITLPNTSGPIVTAPTMCATQDPVTCCTQARVENLAASLLPVGIPIGATAAVLQADACCGANGPVLSSTITNLAVSVGGTPLVIPVNPPPNTTVAVPANPLLSVTLVLNEQIGNTVRAVHLTVVVLSALGAPLQRLELIIAEATAPNCP